MNTRRAINDKTERTPRLQKRLGNVCRSVTTQRSGDCILPRFPCFVLQIPVTSSLPATEELWVGCPWRGRFCSSAGLENHCLQSNCGSSKRMGGTSQSTQPDLLLHTFYSLLVYMFVYAIFVGLIWTPCLFPINKPFTSLSTPHHISLTLSLSLLASEAFNI